MAELSRADIAFFDDPDNWDLSGPSFHLFFWAPTDYPREAIQEALLADGRIFRYASCGTSDLLPAGAYVLFSPAEFPTAVGVGHSHVHRPRERKASHALFVRSGHMEHACGTDCLNEGALGDSARLVAFYALLISVARGVRMRVPITSPIIRGEAWAWPRKKEWGELIAVHRDVAQLADWGQVELDEEWVGVGLV
jgi:hypothetical protein